VNLNEHISVTVPGTCGELVQGWSAEWDEPVLVSCPIAHFNRLTVQPLAQPTLIVTGDDTASTAKLKHAAHLTLNAVSAPKTTGISLLPHRALPVERGMGSSTADVVAAVAGTAALCGRTLSPAEIARLACQIEPSDSTMFAPLTVLAYRSGNRYRELGHAPSLPLLVLDTARRINTRLFNFRLDEIRLKQLAPVTAEALAMLTEGISRQNGAAIGAAATLSAESFQHVWHSDFLPQVQQWAAETHAFGVVRAHSGSVMGLLYPFDADIADIFHWLRMRFAGKIFATELTAGGAILEQYTGGV